MWGILVFGLFVELLIGLYHLLMAVWPYVAAAAALVLLWRWVLVPLLEFRAREARDRLRHERARQQINAVETAAMRAMVNVAQTGDAIEGTSTSVEPTGRRPR